MNFLDVPVTMGEADELFAAGTKTEEIRIHLDIESDNVLAEAQRLEDLGAIRVSNQTERGYDFWVMQDPWQNEFCVLQIVFPDLLAATDPRTC